MTLEEALATIQNDSAPYGEWARAADRICFKPDSTYEDILICLERGGIAAEFAVMGLYLRTNRPRDNSGGPLAGDSSAVWDPDDWRAYLGLKKKT